jgi:hypothetical protein
MDLIIYKIDPFTTIPIIISSKFLSKKIDLKVKDTDAFEYCNLWKFIMGKDEYLKCGYELEDILQLISNYMLSLENNNAKSFVFKIEGDPKTYRGDSEYYYVQYL